MSRYHDLQGIVEMTDELRLEMIIDEMNCVKMKKLKDGEITQDEYDNYWNNNCGKCVHMVEICMYGEGEEI